MMPSGPVLIGYDGSPHAKVAIEQAGALLRSGPAVVASAWVTFERKALMKMPGHTIQDAVASLDEAERETAEELAAEGAQLASEAGFDARPLAVRARGPFFEALVRCADELDAAAIVVGTRGRSTLAATVLGSVSTGVLHHTSRPVLVVRAAE
jgi:nucleotide-binding universal stress UspA family protein